VFGSHDLHGLHLAVKDKAIDHPAADSKLPVLGAAFMTIQPNFTRWLIAFLLLNTGVVFAGGFKSKIITTSPLTIAVPDDRVLKITNFTQEGGTERAVVRVNLSGDFGGTANVLTAVRIDFSTGMNSQSFPEINNRVVIAGPAEVRVAPVPGATLVITYKKEPNEGAGEETTPIPIISPTPSGSATPGATPSASPSATPTPTVFP
jgi:hypothetical protein